MFIHTMQKACFQIHVGRFGIGINDSEQAQSKTFQEKLCGDIIKKEKLGYTIEKMRKQISFFSDPEKNHITGHAQGNIW